MQITSITSRDKNRMEKLLSPVTTDYEMVFDLSGNVPNSPLQGFIAIHSTFLGPALGGTRLWNYQDHDEALKDALRLSRAMTYKCAVAGLPFGGGKGVIIYDGTSPIPDEILQAYAQKVSALDGDFYTGEDVGLTEENVQHMMKFSRYFIGKTGQAGDPSKYAAFSTFQSIKLALEEIFGRNEVSGRSFAIKGAGKTGHELAKLIYEEGGKIIISDIDKRAIKKVQGECPEITPVSIQEIMDQKVDVFCPCALGNDITKNNTLALKAKIIAGTANNQLESEDIGDQLYQTGILYVPDYVANAGGLINVADELLPGGYNKSRVMSNINKLKDTFKTILKLSKEQNLSPNRIADRIAEERFQPLKYV